jgi:site-specific recombinase XerD
MVLPELPVAISWGETLEVNKFASREPQAAATGCLPMPLDQVPVLAPSRAMALLDSERAELEADLAAGKAESTRRAYQGDGRAFATWCRERGLDPLAATPDTVALHLSSSAAAGLSPASLSRRIAGIAYFLSLGGIAEDALPTRCKLVRETLAGIRRRRAKPSRRKSAATTPLMFAMLSTCGDDLLGRRDRALLALGFGAALRRSELVALNVEDLEEVKNGYNVAIRRSKTDQEGEGCVVPVGRGSILKRFRRGSRRPISRPAQSSAKCIATALCSTRGPGRA